MRKIENWGTLAALTALLSVVGAAGCTSASEDGAGDGSGSGGKADGTGVCAGIGEPPPGSEQRTSFVNALHAVIDPTVVELGAPKLTFEKFRVYDGMAYLSGSLCLQGADTCVPITDEQIAMTSMWGPLIANGVYGGNHFDAIVDTTDNGVEVIAWDFAGTDVAFEQWFDELHVPQELVLGCEEQQNACDHVYEPAPGAGDRAFFAAAFHEVIDPTVAELGTPKFIFSTIRVYDDSVAFMEGSLCLPAGETCVPITEEQLATTAEWGPLIDNGVFDSNHFYAVVGADSEDAEVIAWAFGPTDAPLEGWPAEYSLPEILFKGCAE